MRIYNKTVQLTLLMCAIALALGFLALPHSAKAASTYTVDSIGDEADDNPGDLACHTALDTCTLRAAIQEVNAGTGGDTINFGIAGSGVHTLTPTSAYDTITQSVTINGYSQPGSAVNTAVAPAALNGTLTIEIDGTGAGGVSDGFNIAASNVTISGLVINRFANDGIRTNGVSGITIAGNYIGTDTTGLIGESNNKGIFINNSTVTVGGTSAADRNLISGGRDSGIAAEGSNLVVIQGNFIGTNAAGTGAIANIGSGISIVDSSNVTIGGSVPGAINVIAGNEIGIYFQQLDSSIIESNYIGLDRTGTTVLANTVGILGVDATNNAISNNVVAGSAFAPGFGYGGIMIYSPDPTGVIGNTFQGNKIGTDKNGNAVAGGGNTFGIWLLANATNNLIGGTGAGEGNTIAYNDGPGVQITDFIGLDTPINNSIIGNNIHDNGALGIDLNGADANPFDPNINVGVTPNDVGDPDESSNHYMNFPVINSATKGSGQVTVNYDLDINPAEVGATGYSVDFYANTAPDPSGNGQGEFYLGSDTVAGDVTGQSKTLTLPGSVPADYYVTAVTTMTDVSSDGYGHSSEFSAAVQAIAAPVPPDPTPTPSPSGTSSSSLANTGQPQHTNQRLMIAIALIALGTLGIAGLTGQRLYTKRRKSRV